MASQLSPSYYNGNGKDNVDLVMSFLSQVLINKLLLLFTVIVCGNFLHHILLSPLKSIPGPVVARLTRLWLAIEGYRGTFHTTLLSLHDEYGELVRIGPNELSVVEPRAVKIIYGLFSLTTHSGLKITMFDLSTLLHRHRL
jgi:hypothetical protein